MKEEMQARVLSYLYLFMTHDYRDIGAGDLATASVLTGLSGNNGKRGKTMYNSTHGLITKIYNDLTNGSLPGYVLNIPKLYAITDEDWLRRFNSLVGNRGVVRGVSELIAIMDEIETIDYMSIQNYYFLWFSYINRSQYIAKVVMGVQITKNLNSWISTIHPNFKYWKALNIEEREFILKEIYWLLPARQIKSLTHLKLGKFAHSWNLFPKQTTSFLS